MALKLICPNNPDHKGFSVTAHVTQIWWVNQDGDFVETVDDCVDVTHRPDKDDLFTCMDCSAEAQIEEV